MIPIAGCDAHSNNDLSLGGMIGADGGGYPDAVVVGPCGLNMLVCDCATGTFCLSPYGNVCPPATAMCPITPEAGSFPASDAEALVPEAGPFPGTDAGGGGFSTADAGPFSPDADFFSADTGIPMDAPPELFPDASVDAPPPSSEAGVPVLVCPSNERACTCATGAFCVDTGFACPPTGVACP
jgi:hypothetical protein